MIDNGADVNIETCYSVTPLIFSCSNTSYEITRLLLDNDADINYINYNMNDLVTDEFANVINTKIIDFLLEYKYDGYSQLMIACGTNNTKLVKFLIEHGAYIEECILDMKDREEVIDFLSLDQLVQLLNITLSPYVYSKIKSIFRSGGILSFL